MYDTSALTNHRAEHVLRRIAGVPPTASATPYSTHTTVNERDLLPSTQISCAIQGGKEKARFRSALHRSHGGAPFMSTLAHTELASLGKTAAIDRKLGGRNRPDFGMTTRGRAILLLPDLSKTKTKTKNFISHLGEKKRGELKGGNCLIFLIFSGNSPFLRTPVFTQNKLKQKNIFSLLSTSSASGFTDVRHVGVDKP